MDTETAIASLHATFARRDTPETVAGLVSKALPDNLSRKIGMSIQARLASSVKRMFGFSSMPEVFKSPALHPRGFDKGRELGLLFLGAQLPDGDEPEELELMIAMLNGLIHRTPGAGSFRDDRLNGSARIDKGLQLSRRRYAKLFRLAGRLEQKLDSLRAEETKHRLLLVAKAGLAPQLRIDDLGDSVATAAFIAYFSARMKLRSEFTIAGQQRPFDDLAAALLRLCEKDDGANWYAIAHVFPRADVLARLSQAQKGELLGRWFSILSELGEHLEAAWRRTHIDLDRMIVKRGNDSSTWNLFAGAWNRARDHWIALVEALEMSALFDEMLPGKVMRLMAADVAAWHFSAGGALHPDTCVWAELPKPWDVLRQEADCDRAAIEATCARHGVDPVKSGWSAARPRSTVSVFRPTPELVHGVSVSNPHLAAYLKKLGAFSGKPLRRNDVRMPKSD